MIRIWLSCGAQKWITKLKKNHAARMNNINRRVFSQYAACCRPSVCFPPCARSSKDTLEAPLSRHRRDELGFPRLYAYSPSPVVRAPCFLLVVYSYCVNVHQS